MKIRIKKLPKAKQGGFFNNLPWAGSNPNNPFGSITSDVTNEDKTYNDSIKAIKKEDANVEAEKGEVLFKFDAGGIFKINGKKHSEGGTPLKVDAGDFIFSNDKALAITKKEAEKFEVCYSDKGKAMNTPAKILSKDVDLKQYNKFIATLLDPKSDEIAKRTAQLMLEKYSEKIGQIAYLQEAKKGFPQGMPEFSHGTAPVYANEVDDEIKDAPQYAKYGGWVMQQGGLFGAMRNRQQVEEDPFVPVSGDGNNGKIPTGAHPRNIPNWGLWQGDLLPTFKNRFGVTNAADKISSLDEISTRLGYTGPKDNKAFQQWLYNSSPENKAIIDKWHSQYEDPMINTPVNQRNRFDGKIGIRWAEAMNEMLNPPRDRVTNIPITRQPLPQFTPKVNLNRPNVVQPGQVPELPFQGFNIGMNAQEVLSGIMPYMSALSLPTYYDMLTQKYSPNIRLDRLNNTEEVNNIQQQSSLAQRELFSNLSGQTAALATGDLRANEMMNIGKSNANINNANTQIANQESMVNYQADQQDNMFNLQNVHQTYNNNVLARQRRNEQLANGTIGSLNNFMAIQNNLDGLNQQMTAAVLPYLSTVDAKDKNGNPIKVQVPPMTINRNRIPVPTGFGSFDAAGIANLANAPNTDDYNQLISNLITVHGMSPNEAGKTAAIIMYTRSGNKGSAYDPSNPFAAIMAQRYNFKD